eukprot:3388870-Amphidinium_carterae.1
MSALKRCIGFTAEALQHQVPGPKPWPLSEDPCCTDLLLSSSSSSIELHRETRGGGWWSCERTKCVVRISWPQCASGWTCIQWTCDALIDLRRIRISVQLFAKLGFLGSSARLHMCSNSGFATTLDT